MYLIKQLKRNKMKVQRNLKEDQSFKPIRLSLVIENQDELNVLLVAKRLIRKTYEKDGAIFSFIGEDCTEDEDALFTEVVEKITEVL